MRLKFEDRKREQAFTETVAGRCGLKTADRVGEFESRFPMS